MDEQSVSGRVCFIQIDDKKNGVSVNQPAQLNRFNVNKWIEKNGVDRKTSFACNRHMNWIH